MPDITGAVANYSAYLATLENRILIKNNGFFIADFSDSKTEKPANLQDLKNLADSYKTKAENDLQMTINLMLSDIGQYPLFQESKVYKSMQNTDYEQTKKDKSIFI